MLSLPPRLLPTSKDASPHASAHPKFPQPRLAPPQKNLRRILADPPVPRINGSALTVALDFGGRKTLELDSHDTNCTTDNHKCPVDESGLARTNCTRNSFPCSYAWRLSCPGEPDLTSTNRTWYVSVSHGQVGSEAGDIDATAYNATAPLRCTVTLTVANGEGTAANATAAITVTPVDREAPEATIWRAPLSETVAAGASKALVLDARGSSCGRVLDGNLGEVVLECSFSWRLRCPGASVRTYDLSLWRPTAGSGDDFDIDTTRAATRAPDGSFVTVCDVSVTVTNSRNSASSANTTLTITQLPAAAPTPVIAGAPVTVPLTYATRRGSVPFTLDGSASACTTGRDTCSFDWRLRCPGASLRTYDAAVWRLTAGGDLGVDVDASAVNGSRPLVCDVSLTVTNREGANATAESTVTIAYKLTHMAAPVIVANSPLNISVPFGSSGSVSLSRGRGSNCTTGDKCYFGWRVKCPTMANETWIAGDNVTLNVGRNADYEIDLGPPNATNPVVCEVRLVGMNADNAPNFTTTYVSVT